MFNRVAFIRVDKLLAQSMTLQLRDLPKAAQALGALAPVNSAWWDPEE